MTRRVLASLGLLTLSLWGIVLPAAPTDGTYAGALAPVPAGAVDAPTMTGTGIITAILAGRRLDITGTFANLESPAVAAGIHRARGGMRGPRVLDVTVPRAGSGKIQAQLALTPAQVQDLQNGWLYIQIATERHAEGQVRAWLLPAPAPR